MDSNKAGLWKLVRVQMTCRTGPFSYENILTEISCLQGSSSGVWRNGTEREKYRKRDTITTIAHASSMRRKLFLQFVSPRALSCLDRPSGVWPPAYERSNCGSENANDTVNARCKVFLRTTLQDGYVYVRMRRGKRNILGIQLISPE